MKNTKLWLTAHGVYVMSWVLVIIGGMAVEYGIICLSLWCVQQPTIPVKADGIALFMFSFLTGLFLILYRRD